MFSWTGQDLSLSWPAGCALATAPVHSCPCSADPNTATPGFTHLPKVASGGGGMQRGQVDAIEGGVLEEGALLRHLSIQRLVAKGAEVHAAQAGEHLACRQTEKGRREQRGAGGRRVRGQGGGARGAWKGQQVSSRAARQTGQSRGRKAGRARRLEGERGVAGLQAHLRASGTCPWRTGRSQSCAH